MYHTTLECVVITNQIDERQLFMRVFALSDLHADFPPNLSWIHSLSSDEYRNDFLILAGDVSDLPVRLEVVFVILKKLPAVPGVTQTCDETRSKSRRRVAFESSSPHSPT